jgi:dihydrofolate synthase / folylpolyglutamate synthase
MRFAEAVAELDARWPEHMPGPSLVRISRIAALLNDPQLTYPTIHVTGTNGKSTTARVAAALGCGHGITTGLYTSPHLLSVRERLSVCGVEIREEDFAEEYEHLLPYLRMVDDGDDGPVTYFEALTALAFLWFADRPVGLGVFEVGMGGGWDATNLVASDVAVLCPISLDHPELGSTIAEVANEKAGIIKSGKVVVSREQDEEALAVIRARCNEVGAELRLELVDFEVLERLHAAGGQSFRVRGLHAEYDDLFVPLFGEHAVRNAATAIVALEALFGHALGDKATRDALAGVRSPGRLEAVGRRPLIVLDGAHNPAGARALAESLAAYFGDAPTTFVLGVLRDKDAAGILAPLVSRARRLVLTASRNPRAAAPAELEKLVPPSLPVVVAPSIREALAIAEADTSTPILCVAGSLSLVGDALGELAGNRDKPCPVEKPADSMEALS